jgi:serine/threonine protein kinase
LPQGDLTKSEKPGQDTASFSPPTPAPSPPATTSLLDDTVHPTQIGRYVVQRFLGGGGYDRVFLANDSDLDRSVAIKIPKKKFFESGQTIDRFVQEARIAARLKHNGLVAVHDVQKQGDWPYIVHEYVEGPNLQQWMRDNVPRHDEIVRLLIEITEAVGVGRANDRFAQQLHQRNSRVDTTFLSIS